MDTHADPAALAALRDYAEGRLGTRQAIEYAHLQDYAELVIALARNNLDLPKPPDTARRAANLARARAILQPRLRRGR
jgi:hypothetical protein